MDHPQTSIIRVYRINGLKREEADIDYKSTSWKKSDGLWEDPQGWIPVSRLDDDKIKEFTIKRIQKDIRSGKIYLHNQPDPQEEDITDKIETDPPKKDKEEEENKIEGSPSDTVPSKQTSTLHRGLPSSQNDEWREVLSEQQKATRQAQEEQEIIRRAAREKAQRLEEEKHALETRKKWTKRILFGFVGSLCIVGAVFYYSHTPQKKDIFGEPNASSNKESAPESPWGFFSSTPPTEPAIADSTKIHVLKYTIEESIWAAKVKAALYDNKVGQTTWEPISKYLDFDSNLHKVLGHVRKLYKEMAKKDVVIKKEDFATELEHLKTLIQEQESKALPQLGSLVKESTITLGTYPHKQLAKKANRENWISPLGKLHEDVTGKPQKSRFITDPQDPRSVGEPTQWKD